MLSLTEARARVLGRAEPGEAIEVALSDAVGLVLAEPLVGDVDLPPFDRAGVDGYAVRAGEAAPGGRLRVVGPAGGRARRGPRRSTRRGVAAVLEAATTAELTLAPGEAAHVTVGSPLPVGADAVVRTEDTRPDPGNGPPREVEVLRAVAPGHGVVSRGYYLAAGTTLAPEGTRLRLPMVGLLAAQGCVHPVCHRRVRVATLAVGDHLVGPAEPPVMHRERNAAGMTAVVPCLHWGATAHDLGSVSERDLPDALERALTAHVAIILGEPEGAVPRALKRAGVEFEFEGVALHPGKRVSYGIAPDGSGFGAGPCHVFHVAPGPVGVLTAVALLVGPLIGRLQGGPSDPPPPLRAAWSGEPHRATDDRTWAVPVTLAVGPDARLSATPVDHRGKDDVVNFARAEGLALLPPRSGPWNGGEVVEVVPLGSWPPGAPGPSALA